MVLPNELLHIPAPFNNLSGHWIHLLTNTNKVSLDLANVSFADENGGAELVN